MFRNKLIALATAAALLVSPVQQAAANDFAAGLVTGVLGTIIVNQGTKRPPPGRTVVVRPESPQRTANRITQSALNYFGFNSGTPDGVFGPKTANAVRSYQSYMGFPLVGRLTAVEREILVNAYNRGQGGDAATLRLVSTDPAGARALLMAEKNAMFGVVASNGGTAGGSTVVTTSGDDGAVSSSGTSTPVVAAPGVVDTPTLLPLIPVPTGNTNLATLCAPSGMPRVTPVSMGPPEDALTQAFCDAVVSAKETSTGLANSVPGVTLAQIEGQCEQLGPVVAGYVASLTTKSRDAVMVDVQAFVDGSGADPAQLASTARICLGTGYGMANMDVALGSALLLTAMGEPAYGELAGHHLYHGVGVATDTDKGLDWLVWSTDQVSSGATMVFGDGLRTDLVEQAVLVLNGGAPSAASKSTGSKGKIPMISTNN